MTCTVSTCDTERLIARVAGRRYCRLVHRGATAIYIACKILGERYGYGEVIVPAIGCLSIPQAVALAGHRIVFADIDPRSGCLSPEDLASRITLQTKAILPIHIFGHVVDMDRVAAISERHGIGVIEDACHALGGRCDQRPVGSWGMFSIASFGGTKTLGGLGGGAILFDDDDFRVHIERHIGTLSEALGDWEAGLFALSHRNLYHAVVDIRRAKSTEAELPTVSHMSAAYSPLLLSRNEVSSRAKQAICHSAERLPEIISERCRAVRFYDEMISRTPCRRVPIDEIEEAGAIWRYTFTCPSPSSTQTLTNALRRAGIHASNHYWSLAEVWDNRNDLPGASWFQERVVNLWVDATATPEYLQRTSAVVAEWSREL